jgi:hypothetical protein
MRSVRPDYKPLWWCYFALLVLSELVTIPVTEYESFTDVGSTLFSGFGLIPIAGYISQLRIGWYGMWVGYAILTFGILLAGLIFGGLEAIVNLSSGQKSTLLFGLGFSLLAVWAVIAYTWFSPHLWSKSSGVET